MAHWERNPPDVGSFPAQRNSNAERLFMNVKICENMQYTTSQRTGADMYYHFLFSLSRVICSNFMAQQPTMLQSSKKLYSYMD